MSVTRKAIKVKRGVVEYAEAPIVGLKEVGDILGLNPESNQAWQLARCHGFPEPIVELAATRIWLRSEIQDFADLDEGPDVFGRWATALRSYGDLYPERTCAA